MGDAVSLAHIDLYRLGDSGDLDSLGLDDYLSGAWATVIEWPERAVDDGLIPVSYLDIAVADAGEQVRALTFTVHGDMPAPSARARVGRMIERTPGLLLALDTSSDLIGYAITDGDQLLAEAIWRGQRQGTAMLLAAVMRALDALGRTQDDLGAVAVATGPGSFSGLRVGMGIAKGLALGLAIPIVGIPTLAVTAEPFCSGGATNLLVGPGWARSFCVCVVRGAFGTLARIDRRDTRYGGGDWRGAYIISRRYRLRGV